MLYVFEHITGCIKFGHAYNAWNRLYESNGFESVIHDNVTELCGKLLPENFELIWMREGTMADERHIQEMMNFDRINGYRREFLPADRKEELLKFLGPTSAIPSRPTNLRINYSTIPLPCCGGVQPRCFKCGQKFTRKGNAARHYKSCNGDAPP